MWCSLYLEAVSVALPARLPWYLPCCLLQTLPLSLPVWQYPAVRSLLLGPPLCPAGAWADPRTSPGPRGHQLPRLLVQHQLPRPHQGPHRASEWWLVSSRLFKEWQSKTTLGNLPTFTSAGVCSYDPRKECHFLTLPQCYAHLTCSQLLFISSVFNLQDGFNSLTHVCLQSPQQVTKFKNVCSKS